MLNWANDKRTLELVGRVARRAVKLAEQHDIKYNNLKARMDIEACHCNGCPLDLQGLLDTDDGNFGHDVFGIRANIDRTTGQLLNCFLPRYAA